MTVKLLTMVLSVMLLVALAACSDDSDEAVVSTVQTQAAAPVVKKEASPVVAVVKASEKDDDEKHDEDEEHDEDEKHDHDEDEEHDEDEKHDHDEDEEHDEDEKHDHDEDEEHDGTVISIVDALGQTLEFKGSPERIVTISPTATEMLYLVGGKAVGRDRASNFPVEATSLPDVGSGYDPSIETLMGMRPDLVIVEALTQARFVPMLGQMGLTVMAVKVESVDDVVNNITNVGKVVGNEEGAASVVSDIKSRLEAAGTIDKSVLLLISDADRNLYAAKPESYTGLIATVLGMDNKAAGLPDSGPFPGFTMMSPEAILMANPDVLVTITPAPKPAPRLSESIRQIPPFAGLKAIQTNMVIEGDLTLFLQSPGPRIVEAVEFLRGSLD